jgi:hypothetical protein
MITPMRHRLFLFLIVQSLLVAIVAALVIWGRVPLGVPGQWTWSRLEPSPQFGWMPLGVLGIGLYAGFARWGGHGLANPRRRTEAAWLAGLALMAVIVQVTILTAAPNGFGLIKWATIRLPGASGYVTVAEREVSSIGEFWADYPEWIRRQDALHVGTHPPGLIVVSRWVVDRTRSNPELTEGILSSVPVDLDAGLRAILGPLPKAERAAVVVIGFATLLACALTVVPIYVLARARLSPAESWSAAALWPVVPSAILFQPTADCAFPFLSTTALGFAAWSCRGKNWPAAFAGIVLAVGMQFTLAFLPVGLIVAIVLLGERGARFRRVGATAIGFFSVTGLVWLATSANPFAIWWTNSRNHARFYQQFPRSYVSWVCIDLIELSVAIGPPILVWAIWGLSRRRDLIVCWATVGVLVFLNFSGKNLSEVARLWLPFMPPLLLAAGAGMRSLGGGAKTLAATIALVGLATLLLQTTIQVVYPV